MVRNREKKIPPEPPLYIMVLDTVVSSELSIAWTVQLSWLWNLCCPQHVGHWKSEHTFYISFGFSVSPGFVEVRGIRYQQLSTHSSWSNIPSRFLKEVRNCRPADSCRLRQNNRAVCVYPTVGRAARRCRDRQQPVCSPSARPSLKWDVSTKQETATVSKRGNTMQLERPPANSLTEWVRQTQRHFLKRLNPFISESISLSDSKLVHRCSDKHQWISVKVVGCRIFCT